MKKLLVAGVLSLGLLIAGNQVANAETISPKVDTTYNKYIEKYLVEDNQKDMIFSKTYFDRDDIGKVIKVDGNVDCYVLKDDHIKPDGEKSVIERPVPVSLWESRFTGKPKPNREYILVTKRNYFTTGGYLKAFEPIDIIEIEKPKKTLKLPKRINDVLKAIS
ncbi:hypothetical protein [Lysinibacillus sp. NPDC086135]|uniref:hypothetical protein n=1 Tax=Lysinibacillus sp. NPDC086135 TaxID=3364130 RepID=UPI003829C32A